MLRKPLAQIYNDIIGNHRLHDHLIPAFRNLTSVPHQAIPTIASCTREYGVHPDTLPVVLGTMRYIAEFRGVLTNPKTFHSFGILLLSSTYHTSNRHREFARDRIQIKDITRVRAAPFLMNFFSHNTEAANVLSRLNNLKETPRIPLLTDRHWATDYFGYRDVCREYNKSNLSKTEVTYLLQLCFQMADLARFHATLSYPHLTAWYESEKREIGAMWRKLIQDQEIADKITRDTFNEAEIGYADEDKVRQAQEKALSDPMFSQQVIDIAQDFYAFHECASRFSALRAGGWNR